MKYHFNSRHQYHLVRDYQILTSPLVLVVLLGSLIGGMLGWLALFFFATTTPIIALTMLATSVFFAAALTLTFGATYFPYVSPRLTVQRLLDRKSPAERNAAAAASFALLQALGPAAQKKNTPKSLEQSVASLIRSPATAHLMRRLEFDRETVNNVIREVVVPKLTWSRFAKDMLAVARSFKQPAVEPEHALGALLLRPEVQPHLRATQLTDDDVRFALWWGTEQRARTQYLQRWWEEERLLAFSGIGLSWASGYTPFVDRFSRIPRGSSWDNVIYGHEEKLDSLITSLARQRQSNVLLAGDPGVGRLGIIRRLAWLVQVSKAHPALNGQRVLYINVGELVAQSGTGGNQLANVSRALREMERAGNIIAVIDGLSSILGEAGEQRVNLTDILIPFLSSSTVRVVVMTSSDEYHLRLKSNEELTQYFEVVLVPSLSEEATLRRLALTLPTIERSTKLFIPYKTIRTLVEDTSSLIPHVPFPERAFDFLEEAVVIAQRQGAKVLEPSHIHATIAQKTGINMGRLRSGERQKLLSLAELMHRRLVNQNAAVEAVARAMIRARAEIRSTKRPIGTFLFLGPTGVGKTETAKTLAEVYFGSEERMVRLDMSEFQGTDAIARLIGSPDQPVGRLTSLIADHPFTVLLLDEFEKADEQVHQLFLQVLDEGRVTDVSGRTFSFRHTIIIVTSNAGAELIRKQAKDGHLPPDFDEKLKEHILRNNILRPELLNRFDDVITYTPLTSDHITQIARLMLRSLNQRLDAEHGVTVAVTDALVDFLVSIGYHPEFGARPMTRAIQDTVEYAVAQKVLKGEIQPGQQLQLQPELLRSLKQRQG